MLSLLAYHDPNATCRASTRSRKQDRPPVNIVRFAFQTMAGIGTVLAAARPRVFLSSGGASGACRVRRGSTAR